MTPSTTATLAPASQQASSSQRPQGSVEAPECLGPAGSAARVERTLRLLSGRWKLAILFRLFASPIMRFSELEQSIAKVSHRMLTLHLRELERDGLVERTVHPSIPPKVDYRLTAAGHALRPILIALRDR